MVTLHPQLLCLCLTVRAPLSGLPQTMKRDTEGLTSGLTSPALAMLTFRQVLLALVSKQTQLNGPVSQAGIMTAIGRIAATAGMAETAGTAAAAAGLKTARTITAPASALHSHRGMQRVIGFPHALSLALIPDCMTEVLTGR